MVIATHTLNERVSNNRLKTIKLNWRMKVELQSHVCFLVFVAASSARQGQGEDFFGLSWLHIWKTCVPYVTDYLNSKWPVGRKEYSACSFILSICFFYDCRQPPSLTFYKVNNRRPALRAIGNISFVWQTDSKLIANWENIHSTTKNILSETIIFA